MLKKYLINISLFLLSTLLTLLFAEFLVRSFFPEHNIWNYNVPMQVENFRTTGVPNTVFEHKDQNEEYKVGVRINKYGFRDQQDIKNSSIKDWVVLGDSFSFGYGVEEEERFGNILQKKMKNRFKFYNVAFPVCHFLNYEENLAYTNRKGLKADNIIVGVCMENDLLVYESLFQPKKIFTLKNIKKWLHNNSVLYAFVGQRIHSNEVIENLLSTLGLVNDNSLPTIYSVSDAAIISSVQQLKKVVRGKNALIVIIPSRLVWSEKHQEKANEIHQKFIKKLELQSLLILDIKSVFDVASEVPLTDFHFKNDGHWNVRGHKLVGEALADEIEKMVLN